jgi:hypothetical protein
LVAVAIQSRDFTDSNEKSVGEEDEEEDEEGLFLLRHADGLVHLSRWRGPG